MKNYFYIMCNTGQTYCHCGTSKNMANVIKWYESMPKSIINGSKLNRLVYLEEYTTPENSHERFEQVSKFTMAKKKALIETVNENYLEITLNDIN